MVDKTAAGHIRFRSLDELGDFIRRSHLEDEVGEYYDGGMNYESERVFSYGGHLYSIDYTNDHPRWRDSGTAIYAYRVCKHIEMIEKVSYHRISQD